MKQVNTINTELIDMYLSEVEACRKRLKEADEAFDNKNTIMETYRYSMRELKASIDDIKKYDEMIDELAKLEVAKNKCQTQLYAVCSELEKAVKLKALEAIAVNYHILKNTPVHYKKFGDTMNAAIGGKWRFLSYLDSYGNPTMYVYMDRVNFSDSHIYMNLNDRKINWEDTTRHDCLLSIDEIYKEVSDFYKYKENLSQAFKNLRQIFEDMRGSLHNNYLSCGIYDFYYKKTR